MLKVGEFINFRDQPVTLLLNIDKRDNTTFLESWYSHDFVCVSVFFVLL